MPLAFWHQLRRICAAWIAISCSLVVGQVAASSKLSFSHVLPAQVEALGHINAIVMDAAGYMWFAGISGLGRYDGYELKVFRHQPQDSTSLASSAVNGLLIDSKGRLWAATEAGVSLFDAASEQFTNYRAAGAGTDLTATDATRALIEGAPGLLWVASAGGLLRFDTAAASYSSVDLQIAPGVDPGIWDLASDPEGRLWLATRAQGLLRFDPATNGVSRLPISPETPGALQSADLRAVHVDARGQVWVGSFSGYLQSIDSSGAITDYAPPAGGRREAIWTIISDRKGALWVGDGAGINRLAPGSRVLERHVYSEFEPTGPANHVPLSAFEDSLGQLWFGYFPTGVDRLDREAAGFRNFRHLAHDSNTITDGGVLSALEDSAGDLWVGTGFGLNHVNRQSGRVSRYTAARGDPNALSGNPVLSLHLDRTGGLWAGVWSGGLNRLNPATGRVQRQYSSQPGDNRSLLGMEPWRIISDSEGQIWVATELGVNRYDRASDDFTRFTPDAALLGGETHMFVRDLLEVAPGRLLIASDRGLLELDTHSGRYRRFRNRPKDSTSLSADYVKSLLRDSRGRIWVGTHGGGLNLFDPETETFTAYHLDHGLPNPVITSIVEDRDGQLWLTTLYGISRFDPERHTFTNYNQSHGLLGNVFNRNTALMTAAGELFFGSSKGYSLVDTAALGANPVPPPVVFTSLRVFNQEQVPGAEQSVLRRAIGLTEALTLRHDQTVFSLTFAALNFRLPEHNRYAYTLEGFDQRWHFVGGHRTATYTNLDPGRYLFKVRASNNDGVWNDSGRTLAITVLPPPWGTAWAYAGYALLAAVLAWLIWHGVFKHLQLKQQQALNTRLQRLDKMKDTFLATTSHELRTPLNGIIGLADAMMHGAAGPLGSDAMQRLALISQSGKRLAELVNDILDYAKLNEQQVQLRLTPVNLSQLIGEVVQLLQPLAADKRLKLVNEVSDSSPWVLGDANRLRQVLLNLVGNAIQFTVAGSVTVSANERDQWLEVSIADTGIGIPELERDNIFSAFCQLQSGDQRPQGGTGLGLAISRELIEMHGGAISVHRNGRQGSIFRFSLTRVAPVVSEETPWRPQPPRASTGSAPAAAGEAVDATLTTQPLLTSPERYRVLIVDDDPVNRLVLSGMLMLHGYGVVELDNGQDALALVHAGEAVDLVILDVMMPYLDGFEVCRRLRLRFDRRQLPILLLTAKKSDSDLERGYEAGANAFLNKPVSRYELLPQVANLLELRETPVPEVRVMRG